jgi:hypothetical protein
MNTEVIGSGEFMLQVLAIDSQRSEEPGKARHSGMLVKA